jgi:hypothetical protein
LSAGDNREKLVAFGALEVLVECVCDHDSDITLQRVAIIGIFDLIYSSGIATALPHIFTQLICFLQ